MTRNRRIAVLTGSLCAIIGGSAALLTSAHPNNAPDGVRGLIIGVMLGLLIVFLVKWKQERGRKES